MTTKICAIVTALVMAMGSPAMAAKGKKARKGAGKDGSKELRAAVLKQDANGNHWIDQEEVAALRAAFANDPALKKLDQNGDGILEAKEVKAVNKRLSAPEKKKKQRKLK